jgi:phosphatidylinositol alpha-mannosyltransferase
MRIALVSPYSWTYPGGVTRHIEALADALIDDGHHVRVLAPFDPPDRLSARLHRGARPAVRELPGHVVELGRTIGFPANGAISNLAHTPYAITRLRTALAEGAFDVVHVHEPVVPVVAWDAVVAAGSLPLVGTFHTYGTNALTHNAAVAIGARRRMQRLHLRIAVSEAAEWTARRFFGGRYRIVPNGVELQDARVPSAEADGPLRIVFVGQAVERKGLPLLIRAFEALRDHVPSELTLVGVGEDDVAPLLHDATGVRVLGKVNDAVKHEALRDADVLCAPSLGGESFGMVLTEAFAAGTPVVASEIAGYRDVVRDGIDGLLVPRGDATALAAALRDLALDRPRLARMGAAARQRAQRYAWPRVAGEVLEVYDDAVQMAAVPLTRGQRVAVQSGFLAADGAPRTPAERLPSLEPAPLKPARPGLAIARRVATVAVLVLMAGLTILAFQRIGLDRVVKSLVESSPSWVLVGLGLMGLSMVLRAVSWHAILRAALPGQKVRLLDALRGISIGVLMSATLPARLGEPARALVVARRVGRPRESLPAVLGTVVAQTMLNIVALLILGAVMLSSVRLFAGHNGALLAITILPLAVLASVVVAPALLRSGLPARSERVSRWLRQLRAALTDVRSGLRVFRTPKLGAQATIAQLSAWGLQWVACYVLLLALGLGDAGMGAAAAVLFAVNVTAVLPATPSNLGVFQAACVAVLSGGFGISTADALTYGIVLQAVEVATAVAMGTPALLREGLTWKDVRVRALYAAPVQLPPLRERPEPGVKSEA